MKKKKKKNKEEIKDLKYSLRMYERNKNIRECIFIRRIVIDEEGLFTCNKNCSTCLKVEGEKGVWFTYCMKVSGIV